MPRAAIDLWVEALARFRGDRLLRVKAIIAVTEHPDRPIIFHAVQNAFHPPVELPAWPDEDHTTRICIIAKDLPSAECALLLRLAGA